MKEKNKFRIALISPQVACGKDQVRRAQPPLGIGYIAAVLEESGFLNLLILDAVVENYDHVELLRDDPELIKYGMSDVKIVERLKEFSPDLIGMSFLFSSQAECAFSLAEAVKKAFPEVTLVLGGIHASLLSESILKKYPYLDYILTGESDYTFRELAEKLYQGEDFTDIAGLVWRRGDRIIHNAASTFTKDLNQLPFPAWHRMPMEKYFEIAMPHNPFVASGRVGCIMTSRGCPQKCYFCSSADFFGHRFRAMSAQRVVEMVAYLVEKFKIKELQIIDDNFTTDYQRVIGICQSIKKFKLRVTLPNAIRADVPRDHEKRLKMFYALREAGCEQIGIAAEHGDQEFLDHAIGKHLDLKEAMATCRLAHEADLLVHCNFMIGFPFETKVQRQRTADFARNLEADSFSVSFATPLPGTKMWDIVEENNLFLESFNINRVLYSEVSIRPNDISVEELRKFVKNLNRELNEIALKRNPKSREKYNLFKGKSAHGDRKYQFSLEEEV